MIIDRIPKNRSPLAPLRILMYQQSVKTTKYNISNGSGGEGSVGLLKQ